MEHNWETIIAAAKRENNSRRSFVLVNRLQGKHVPASPSQAMEMFRQLADALKQRYPSEPCLAIGFAETATAIGLAVAQACQYASMTTTREPLPDVSYLFFSEAHSHATEQKLVQDDLDSITGQIKRIVFVEDEVTTGRTILQIVQLLRKQYGADRFSFTAASLLNGMGETEQVVYAREQIDCVFLHKTMPELYDDLLAQYTQLGAAHSLPQAHGLTAPVFCFDGRLELRRLQQPRQIQQQCAALWEFVQQQIAVQPQERILVLGTEEFMYPALAIGQQLEQAGCQVWCHATTRSPIIPIRQQGYPLQARWQLCSLYDARRTTYLYELNSYDKVIVITDAVLQNNRGWETLLAALRETGNQCIYGIEWRRL